MIRSVRAPLITAAIAVGGVLAMSACTHPATGGIADNSVITAEELDSLRSSNALEVVQHLRPMFLSTRGRLSVQPGNTPALPNVYVDNQFYGDITTLQGISAANIETIRFFSASDAQYRFGRGNAAGVIGIFTKH
jgi:hypothetical protein